VAERGALVQHAQQLGRAGGASHDHPSVRQTD
jgi:hypothetical protein